MKRLLALLLLLPGLAFAGSVSLTTAATAMVGTPLTGLHTVIIQNQGSADIRCQAYTSTGLTSSTGLQITAGSYASFDRIGSRFEVYCLSTSGTQTVFVQQLN